MSGVAPLAFTASRGFAAPGQGRPNLLIIHTDEHNFRTLGCYRDQLTPDQAFVWGEGVKVETPHIDRIAKEGALCNRFYATTPVCSPSRGSFVTGLYPQNSPVTNNNVPLNDEVVTFSEELRRSGYTTGYAGKWHLDGGGKPQWAPERQFGFADNRYMFNRGHWKKFEDTPEGPRVKGGNSYSVKGADAKSFATDFLCDKAVEFIEANKGRPFSYMVSLPDPHGPNSVRPPYDTMFDGVTFNRPRTASRDQDAAPGWAKGKAGTSSSGMQKYFGMVKCIDDNVGKLLACLRRTGLLDKTIVVFTADHGDLCGEHGKHNKGVPLEASAKIPFLVRYPKQIPAGTIIDEALSCVDFKPTILGLMGVTPQVASQGRNAATLLSTGKAPAGWEDVTFFRSTGTPTQEVSAKTWLAAATRRYKLVFSVTSVPWLIDLQEDPDELTNLLRDPGSRTILRGLAKATLAYAKANNDLYAETPPIKADLAWCIDGTGDYVPAPRLAGGGKSKADDPEDEVSQEGPKKRRKKSKKK